MRRTLIIGATSAIASELARRLAARGDALHLIGRSQHKLDALALELGDAVVGSSCADFIAHPRSHALVQEGVRALGGLDLAVIAHGSIGDQALSESDPEEAERIIATNFTSVVSFLIPISVLLSAQGHGDIAVLSSVAGERGRPRNYTYGAAKGGLTLYLQGLRSRLWPHVGVQCIKLGPVDTPMTRDHAKNPLFARPGPIADRILRAIDRREGEIYAPWYWRVIMWWVRNLPEPIFQRIRFFSGR